VSRTAIARILHPVSVDEFLSSYFERRPLLIRGPREKFSHIFEAQDFKFGLNRVTEIRAVFPGLWQAAIHPADIKEMTKAGASICVTGFELAHSRLLKTAASIKRELNYGGTVSFRAYLSPPGTGFDLHFDARVATTLQIAGSKRWWFSQTPAEQFPEANSPRDRKVLEREYSVPKLSRLKSVLLRPGDLLCLPAGTWHRARAQTMSLALNLAFDHGGAGVLDVLIDALYEKLQSDPLWRAPLPAVPRGRRNTLPPEVAAVLRERAEMLQRVIAAVGNDEATLKRAWTRLVTSRNS
jgi:ribosomal protein L16 Arg81 hydroxylase